mgnify:CR=1 FL=1
MPWQSYGFYFCQGIFPRNSRNTQNFLLRSVDSVGGQRTLTICVDLRNLWEVLPKQKVLNSVDSVGDQRTITICVDLRNLWEVLSKQKVL